MRTPVFIVGCDRSGTTLLRLMLSRSPVLHIPPETGFIPGLWERREEYGDFREARARWFFIRDLQHTSATSKTQAFDAFGLGVEAAEDALARVAPTTYAGAVAALYQASASNAGKKGWGDKTPRYVLHIPLIASILPESRFVHIIRDPRDVAASIVAAGWAGGSFRRAADFWRTRVEAGRHAGRALGEGRYREIRYEELVSDPEPELRDLVSWLGMDFTADMLRFHEHVEQAVPEQHRGLFPLLESPLDPSRAFAWKRSLGGRAIADVESIADNAMAALGYEPTGLRAGPWVRVTRWAYGRLLPLAERLRAAGIVTDTETDDEVRSRV